MFPMKESELRNPTAVDVNAAHHDSRVESMRRRGFLLQSGSVIAVVAASSLIPVMAARQERAPLFAYVGCYTTADRSGHGKGISVFRVDAPTATWTPVQALDGVVNPSFLCFDREQKFLYAVHGDMDYVSAYASDAASGRLTEINREPCGGTNPVHLAVDGTNRFLIVSNYTSGSVAVMGIRPDGSLSPLTDLVEMTGSPGPHRSQQASAHPHHNPFDPNGRFIVVPDKGLDKIFVFRLDAENGKLVAGEEASVTTREGAGPRHVDFHPRLPYVYAINELDSTITTYRLDRGLGELTPLQILPTLPSDYTGNNTGAEIWVHPSGRFVYGSNRGHDSIAIYLADPGSGLLETVGWQPTQGSTPRFFGFDPSGTLLCACNQSSDTIVNFSVDPSTGALSPLPNPVQTGSPVTVVFRRTREG